jgi:hypothetical protein
MEVHSIHTYEDSIMELTKHFGKVGRKKGGWKYNGGG